MTIRGDADPKAAHAELVGRVRRFVTEEVAPRASDVAMKVTVDALQIHGASGYSRDLPLERYVRDAKLTQIYEGTNQIQREVLARQLLG
jgi:alkylation response protein AidB-like acyl-CoA dehydrogenase